MATPLDLQATSRPSGSIKRCCHAPCRVTDSGYGACYRKSSLYENEAVVSQRTRHQAKFTAKAVRRYARTVPLVTDSTDHDVDGAKEPSLRNKLIKRLKELATKAESSIITACANRQIRHTEQSTTAKVQGTWEEQKQTLQDVTATACPSH